MSPITQFFDRLSGDYVTLLLVVTRCCSLLLVAAVALVVFLGAAAGLPALRGRVFRRHGNVWEFRHGADQGVVGGGVAVLGAGTGIPDPRGVQHGREVLVPGLQVVAAALAGGPVALHNQPPLSRIFQNPFQAEGEVDFIEQGFEVVLDTVGLTAVGFRHGRLVSDISTYTDAALVDNEVD